MPAAPKPINELERLDALRSYKILDTAAEAAFDALTLIAKNLCDVPIALVSLIDENRQWFKSNCGLTGVTSTGRDVAFCAYAILESKILEIPDATTDPRFATNPLVTGPPHIRFYAGAPLLDPRGLALGTLCVIDTKPRRLTAEQRVNLERLAVAVAGLITTGDRRAKRVDAFARKQTP